MTGLLKLFIILKELSVLPSSTKIISVLKFLLLRKLSILEKEDFNLNCSLYTGRIMERDIIIRNDILFYITYGSKTINVI